MKREITQESLFDSFGQICDTQEVEEASKYTLQK